MSDDFPLVIIGGSSLVAPWLMQRLRAEERTADIISRSPVKVPEGFRFTEMDMGRSRNWIAPENAVVIGLLPLWVLTKYLPRFIGAKSIVVLGSTSQFSKKDSSDKRERSIAANLENAENNFHEWCRRSNVQGTILRPTMIYDGLRDNNITRMAHFIRRWRFLPLARPAQGRRQPIHADDVAKAIMKAMNNEKVYGKSLNIAGGEILTYKVMAERAFHALNIKPRFLMLKTEWLERGFDWALKTGLVKETAFGSSIFERMNQDLIFDTEEGLRLLDYQPRDFRPVFSI